MDFSPYVNACNHIAYILGYDTPEGKSCDFYVMDKTYYDSLNPELVRDNRGNALVIGDWYVIVTCANGYKYFINVTGDSVMTMCAEVFNFIQYK